MTLRLIACIVPFLAAAASTACSIPRLASPYRMDVRQGNLVTQQMASQLKPGMSKDQVRFVLGTPLVADMFHADRWDYVYRFEPGRGEPEGRLLTVFFQDGKLVRVAGDVVAASGADAAPAAPVQRVIEIAPPGAAAPGRN